MTSTTPEEGGGVVGSDYRASIGGGWQNALHGALADPRFAIRAGTRMARAKWSLRDATTVGSRVRVKGVPRVENKGRLEVAPRVRIVSTVAQTELVVGRDGLLQIGESTFINYGCSISASGRVTIGADCNIGTHVMIMDNEFHSIEPERRNEIPESRPIELADNVWIGGRSIILGGVSIGYGSVIGAGSVVTKDVPARSIAVGVPARVIREI